MKECGLEFRDLGAEGGVVALCAGDRIVKDVGWTMKKLTRGRARTIYVDQDQVRGGSG